ncbi:unnamed protein product [Brassica rapa]|uniref:Uncharacterized protein n=1 Tax=Brassica campestris TaxID=3711 RepID=A0A8D9CY98_BRACM|nr:unnamed protein product [Brassica rapa]
MYLQCEIIRNWIFRYYGECLRRRFSENHLGIADYHHAANFVDVSIYIIIFGGAKFNPSDNTDFYAAGYTLFTLATKLPAQIYY